MKIKCFVPFATVLIFVSATFFGPSLVKSSDEIFSAWQTGNNLPYPLANYPSFVYSDHIYAINGSAQTGASKKSVISSLINQDGSLVSWNNINADTPDALIFHTSAIKENKIYVLGGKVEPSGIGNSVNYVWVGNLNTDGNISDWTTLNSLPKRLSKGKAVIVNNRIYFVGGATWTDGVGPVISNSVYFASINADGTLGGWTATTSLPTPLSGHGLIEANGKIITMGGSTDPGETPINKTYSATVNADGTLGNWSEGPSLPATLRDGSTAKIGAYAVYVGGYSGQFSNKIYYSAIDNNGNLGTWIQSVNNLPTGHCCGSLATWNNRLYLSGGHDGSNYINSVFTSSIPSNLPNLSVPDIKQYSSPWNDDVYDQASSWSSNPSIARWGCALTSTAMVLKYHGHTGADPDVLNNWLKSQPDGYIRNGLLNWLAVSRYTHLHGGPDSPTLEYRRLGTGPADLVSELTANRPAILEEPGHFIVGRSQTTGSFGINDPAYPDRTTLTAYGNSFLSLGSYQPTHTDLSYLMLIADGDINLSISDPTAISYLEQPLTDDIGGSDQSGETARVLLLPQPGDGNYTVAASGAAGLYILEIYFYNSSGEVTLATQAGILAAGGEDNLQVTVGDEPQSLPMVTIDTTIDDWETAYDQGLISKKSVYKSVNNLLKAAKKLWQFNQSKAAKKLLKVTHEIVKEPKHIDARVSSIMQKNIEILLNS